MAYVRDTARSTNSTRGVFDDPSMYKGEIKGITDDSSMYKGSVSTASTAAKSSGSSQKSSSSGSSKTSTQAAAATPKTQVVTVLSTGKSSSSNRYTSADREADAAEIASLEWQEKNLRRSASDAARQAYISRMIAERGLEQKLAEKGATGGMSESARLRIKSDYENERGRILRDLREDLGGISTKIAAANVKSRAAGINLESYIKKYRKLYEELENELNNVT